MTDGPLDTRPDPGGDRAYVVTIEAVGRMRLELLVEGVYDERDARDRALAGARGNPGLWKHARGVGLAPKDLRIASARSAQQRDHDQVRATQGARS